MMKRFTACAVAFFISQLHAATGASNDRHQEESRIAELRAELRGPESATLILSRHCARLGIVPPAIRAMRQIGPPRPASAALHALLRLNTGESVEYRRVRLMCGTRVLSDAENWYVPARLTAAMNRALDQTDTPFGTVVRPLGFHREILDVETLSDARYVLRVHAVLVSGSGRPFSAVVESYRRTLVDDHSLGVRRGHITN